jgi:hypothetical protein
MTTDVLAQPDLPADVERRVTRPRLRLVASTTLRNVVLITIAMLLILVLLPAVLNAQWASVG